MDKIEFDRQNAEKKFSFVAALVFENCKSKGNF